MKEHGFPCLSAAGKLVLLGEYAVAFGKPGLVMAVNRRVRLTPHDPTPEASTTTDTAPDLVRFVREATARQLGVQLDNRCWLADSSCFSQDSIKLGLGSSAAVATVSAASVFTEQGKDITAFETRRQLWTIAQQAHNTYFSSNGSGIDIAASLFGGLLQMRPATKEAPVGFKSLTWPRELQLVTVWTGKAASTPILLQKVREYKQRHPEEFQERIDAMEAAVNNVLQNIDDAETWCSEAQRYMKLMDELGIASGAEIVTPAMKRIARWAQTCGGYAKPSGAGGGDMLLVFFPKQGDPERFKQGLSNEDGLCIQLTRDERGVNACAKEEG